MAGEVVKDDGTQAGETAGRNCTGVAVRVSGNQTKREPVARAPVGGARQASRLMRALRKQRHQHHQIRQGKKPLVSLRSRCFRSARNKAQMAALGKVVDVIDANPRKTRYFRIGEDFLARLYGYHGLAPGPRSLPLTSLFVEHQSQMLVAD